MKKVLSLCLCITCFFVFAGFDWGSRKSGKSTNENSTVSTMQTHTGSSVSTTSANPDAAAVATAAKLLTSGTPAEQKMRMDSLMRVSRILAARNQPTATVAASRVTAPSVVQPPKVEAQVSSYNPPVSANQIATTATDAVETVQDDIETYKSDWESTARELPESQTDWQTSADDMQTDESE